MALRTCLLALIGLLLTLTGQAQDTIPLYSDAIARQQSQLRPSLAIDVFQAVWFINTASNDDSPASYAYPVSVTLYLPDKRQLRPGRTLYINAGYVSYGGTLQRNIYQTGGSAHVRVGVELTRQSLILGYGGLLSGWSGQGSFLFIGPTFGNYEESIGRRNGLAIGGEGHIGAAFSISNRLSIRTVMRGTMMAKLGLTNNLRAPHLSGIDWQSESQVGFGVSLQANLVFRL